MCDVASGPALLSPLFKEPDHDQAQRQCVEEDAGAGGGVQFPKLQRRDGDRGFFRRCQRDLKQKLRALYSLLEESVEEQVKEVNGSAQTEKSRPSEPAHSRVGRSNDGNSGNGRQATKAQLRAIHAIAKEQGSTYEALKQLVADRFGVETPSDLSMGQASALIDTLKNNGKE